MVVVPDQIQEVDAWQSNNVNLDVDEGGFFSAASSWITGYGWYAVTINNFGIDSHYIFVMDKNTRTKLAYNVTFFVYGISRDDTFKFF